MRDWLTDDGFLVTVSPHDFSSNRREQKVTSSKISDLQTSRFKLGDAEDSLEVRIENIKETITETPEEEERDDEAKGEPEGSSFKVL